MTKEVSGTSYTVGGTALACRTVTQNNTNDRGGSDAADIIFSSSTFTALGSYVYKDMGVQGTCLLIRYMSRGTHCPNVQARAMCSTVD